MTDAHFGQRWRDVSERWARAPPSIRDAPTLVIKQGTH